MGWWHGGGICYRGIRLGGSGTGRLHFVYLELVSNICLNSERFHLLTSYVINCVTMRPGCRQYQSLERFLLLTSYVHQLCNNEAWV